MTLVIVCLICLIALIIVLLLVILLLKPRQIPTYRKKDVDFNGAADITTGHIVSSHNQLQLADNLKGTVLLSDNGNIAGVNPSANAFVITLKRNYDNAVFNIDVSERMILGRMPSENNRSYCCVTTMHDVSKQHCCLWRRSDGAVMISDNNSTNHTYVNGTRIEVDTPIHPGDIIRLGGKCELQILY